MAFQTCLRSLAAAVVMLLMLAAPTFAHAELVSSDPTDGAELTASPAAITAIYSEEIDPSRSSITLRDATGATLAQGGVDSADPQGMSMRIDLAAALDPGVYEVRWTTVTSDDNAVLRGTFSFTVEATAGTGGSPAASPTSAVSSTPVSSPSGAAPSTPAPLPVPGTSPAPSPSSPPTPGATAAPSGSSGQPGSGSGDALLPVVVAGIAVLGAAAFLVARRRSGGGRRTG